MCRSDWTRQDLVASTTLCTRRYQTLPPPTKGLARETSVPTLCTYTNVYQTIDCSSSTRSLQSSKNVSAQHPITEINWNSNSSLARFVIIYLAICGTLFFGVLHIANRIHTLRRDSWLPEVKVRSNCSLVPQLSTRSNCSS